jgi:Hemerythrin HHE cation binding domain
MTTKEKRPKETEHGKRVVAGNSKSHLEPARPRIKSLLHELSGEDLRLGLAVIDAATVATTLAADPSNPMLRRQAQAVWSELRSTVAHHLTSEDEVVLPWAEAHADTPRRVIERARQHHRELRALAKVANSIVFETAPDETVGRAAKALYFFAARLDDLIAGEERDLFPLLRHILFAPAAPNKGVHDGQQR